MQVLWSRVAQTRSSCHCRSCLNAATTIARRATTAASRRGLKVGDLFTACYSAVLATAAVADARVKDDRRKEWDRLIAEAKGGQIENGHGNHKIAEGTKTGSDGTGSLNFGLQVNGFENAADITPGNSYLAQKPNYTPLTVQLRALDAHLKQSLTTETESIQPDSVPSSAADVAFEESVDEDDPDHLLPAREPGYNVKYLEKTEENISRLVSQLLLASKTRSDTANGSEISPQLKEVAERIDALQSGHTRLPEFSWRGTDDVMKERERLHWSLVTIFEKASPKDVLVAKICYNLLVSTAPPSIITYNILIRGFTRLRHFELGELVTQAYLEQSRYKPNPATVKITLDHYATKNDIIGFRQVIRRMTAVDGDMRVKRKAVSDLCYPEVQHWALTTKVMRRGPYLRQKFPRNAAIFESLIQGSLKFGQLRSAVVYACAALREGQQIQGTTLSKLVSLCITKSNLLAAKKLLSGILRAWESYIDPNVCRDPETRSILYALLNFCCIDPSSDRDVGILDRSHEGVLRNLLYHLRMEDARCNVERFSGVISKLREIFAVSRPEQSLHGGLTIDKTIHLASALLNEYSAEFETRIRKRYNSALRLVAHHLKVADRLHLRVLNIYFDRLPLKVQMEYQKRHHMYREHSLARKVRDVSKLYRKAQAVQLEEMRDGLATANSSQSDEIEEHSSIVGTCSLDLNIPETQRGSYHRKSPLPLLSSQIMPLSLNICSAKASERELMCE